MKKTVNAKEIIMQSFYDSEQCEEFIKKFNEVGDLSQTIYMALDDEHKKLFHKYELSMSLMYSSQEEALIDYVFKFLKDLLKC